MISFKQIIARHTYLVLEYLVELTNIDILNYVYWIKMSIRFLIEFLYSNSEPINAKSNENSMLC
jgi:hypothetical protein